jgi:hypothetical protein
VFEEWTKEFRTAFRPDENLYPIIQQHKLEIARTVLMAKLNKLETDIKKGHVRFFSNYGFLTELTR